MRPTNALEFPEEQERQLRKSRLLEAVTILYICSSAAALYFTMGNSQAMRASFFEDVISLVPAVTFLICSYIARWPPNRNFPYGYHGAVSIGYLVASVSLIGMGSFLLIESVLKFVHGERTTIGGMHLFGHTIWAGWPMLLAIAYTAIPSAILGRMKLKLAPKIHDKILYADSEMMEADWKAELATATGVLGVGFGFWWLDPLAAALVSLDILKDGFTNLGVVTADLIQRRPRKTDRSGYETLPEDLRKHLEGLDWVEGAEVRLRESGHVFFGEAFVKPRTTENLPERIARAVEEAKEMSWRLNDVTITLVETVAPTDEERSAAAPHKER
jgi:cation diffusion facilitator family transporter